MTRIWRTVAAAAAMATAVLGATLGSGAATAAVLTLQPQHQTVDRGDVAAVDVVVTGLTDQRVAAYDFWVHFDPAILQLLSADVGPSLGGPFDSLSWTELEDGQVNIAELSLLADLSGQQSGNGSLLLFTLRFETLSLGVSGLSFSENILGVAGGFLGDELGAPITISATDSGSITVVAGTPPPPPPPPPTGVPEPGLPLLVLAAAGALALTRRR